MGFALLAGTLVVMYPSTCALLRHPRLSHWCLTHLYPVALSCPVCTCGVIGVTGVTGVPGMRAVVLGGIIWLLKEKGVNFSVLALGVDFLQIISMFSSFGFKCVWMIVFDWWTVDVLLAR